MLCAPFEHLVIQLLDPASLAQLCCLLVLRFCARVCMLSACSDNISKQDLSQYAILLARRCIYPRGARMQMQLSTTRFSFASYGKHNSADPVSDQMLKCIGSFVCHWIKDMLLQKGDVAACAQSFNFYTDFIAMEPPTANEVA